MPPTAELRFEHGGFSLKFGPSGAAGRLKKKIGLDVLLASLLADRK